MQVFLESDGVLADFDKLAGEILGMPPREFEQKKHKGDAGPMWAALYAHEDYFFKLPKMPDADELVAGVEAMGFTPIVLTGIPSRDGSDWAIGQKIRWYEKHYPHLQVICCKSKDKLLHMIEGKHNVLIDDWPQHRRKWREAGGTFILHENAKKSLQDLALVAFKHTAEAELQRLNHEFNRFHEHLQDVYRTKSGRVSAYNPAFSNPPRTN